MKQLSKSELIVNSDGSVYHLGLRPEHLHSTVITVGDPERVSSVTQHFDSIDFEIQNREFKTVGGSIGAKKMTVLSTGIGTDNVDIALNELAFLLNYDLKTLKQRKINKTVDIIRLGTSGSVSKENSLGTIVYTKNAISFDDLFQFYAHDFDTLRFDERDYPITSCSKTLESKFARYKPSLTLTAKGFYGPQFRNSQLPPKYTLQDLGSLSYKGTKVGNIEMETAGIYGLSTLLGFDAISINALLADRLNGQFSTNPQVVINKMIREALDIVCG